MVGVTTTNNLKQCVLQVGVEPTRLAAGDFLTTLAFYTSQLNKPYNIGLIFMPKYGAIY